MPKFATIGIGCESLKMLKNSKRSSLSAEKSLGGKKARGAARRGADIFRAAERGQNMAKYNIKNSKSSRRKAEEPKTLSAPPGFSAARRGAARRGNE